MKDSKKLISTLNRRGYSVGMGGDGHYKVHCPNGKIVSISKTPSDHRSRLNEMVRLRRNGVDLWDGEVEKVIDGQPLVEKLFSIAKAVGLTVRELAAMLETSPTTLYNWRDGANMTVRSRDRIEQFILDLRGGLHIKEAPKPEEEKKEVELPSSIRLTVEVNIGELLPIIQAAVKKALEEL